MTGHPLYHLFLLRLRLLLRNPGVLFWTFVFPVVISLVLGTAFADRPLEPLKVAVAEGSGAQELVRRLEASKDLTVARMPLDEARRQLTQGKVTLVALPGATPEVLVDPTRADGRTARLLLESVLAPGGPAPAVLRATPVSEPGSRYVDFLIPGLLGLSLMSTSVWTMAGPLVVMRGGRLLKRLAATPMRRGQFFAGFALARGVFSLLEMFFFCAFARFAFHVPMVGNYGALAVVVLLGATCFGGMGLLAASRIDSDEAANGTFNSVTLPMLFFSGVFFPVDRMPEWAQPLLHVLPLTPLNDSLRAIILDGATLASLVGPLAALAAWTVVFYAAALRFFRWV